MIIRCLEGQSWGKLHSITRSILNLQNYQTLQWSIIYENSILSLPSSKQGSCPKDFRARCYRTWSGTATCVPSCRTRSRFLPMFLPIVLVAMTMNFLLFSLLPSRPLLFHFGQRECLPRERQSLLHFSFRFSESVDGFSERVER